MSGPWGRDVVTPATAVSAETVFIPNSFPSLTYVERRKGYESDLERALRRVGSVVSLTGRSKSGKTVLAQKVVGPINACVVNCSIAPTPEEFWLEILRQLRLGVSEEAETSASEANTSTGTKGGGLGFPGLLEVHGERQSATEEVIGRRDVTTRVHGPSDAIEALLRSKKTVVLDDFHYLSNEAQRSIGRQLKDAAHLGVPTVILSVPHHDEDPVQAVPDLRGRIYSIRLADWSEDELVEIARKGFPALNLEIPEAACWRLASESIGSPQLMQLLCLETCNELGVSGKLAVRRAEVLNGARLASVFSRAARATNFSILFHRLKTGPAERGPQRTRYTLRDGSQGDIYHVALAALASDPLQTVIPYAELRRRSERACVGTERPTGQGIQGTIERMSRIAREYGGAGSGQREPAIEWMADRREAVLTDSYFVFYLRWEAFPNHAQFAEEGPTAT